MFSSVFSVSLLAAAASAAKYDYKEMGADWGEVASLCATGTEQSPINLTSSSASKSDLMQINGYGYKNLSARKITNNGHTVVVGTNPDGGDAYPEFQIDFPDGSKTVYQPLQFHFHAPSEHQVDGKNYDLELHIVHQKKNTDVELGGVIGIFFDVEDGGEAENPFISELIVDQATSTGKITPGKINLASFLGGVDFTKYYNYKGSLTTPPCSEGIKWIVIADVQSISPEQLQQFTGLWADNAAFSAGMGNNREVQELKSRTVYYHSGAAALIASASVAIASLLAF